MPDRRVHRGLHPKDEALFGPAALEPLRAATRDLCWLLDHGYQVPSALKLTGDRYALTARQRSAVSRCACADGVARSRQLRMIAPEAVAAQPIRIDGFNVLTTLEVALSGGVVLIGRDGVMRDIAGVHGSYRKVAETSPALEVVGEICRTLGVAKCEWLLDRPVSNSGRLRAAILDLAGKLGLPWEVAVVPDPDRLLVEGDGVVASADGQVLDVAPRSLNLARICVERAIPAAFVVDLSRDPLQ